jgi:REP element-mobilizing transposase RayT
MAVLAYHLTWTCYGQWLPGDERGYVDRENRTPGTPYAPWNPRRVSAAANAMQEEACWLTLRQRHLAAEGVHQTCAGQGWRLLALNVQPDHVHVLIDARDVTGKHVMRVLKAFATRRLRSEVASRRRWWTKGGKVELVRDKRHLATVARYIAKQPFDAVS